jgi:hypothetical protein
LESDARWAEYDWGPDPVAWLGTTQEVRRMILDRFGPEQLAPGEWVHELTVRFSLAYLYHRFGIQAAQQYVGGQFQTNAVKGDSQQPTAWVPAERQEHALRLLLAALEPANLDVPEGVAAALLPAPSGTSETRERFPSEAGEVFSPLTAARTLAGLVVHPLLEPARAARLTLAEGRDALTLDVLIRRVLDATWGAASDPTPRRAALRRVAQRVVVDALMDLAARTDAAPEVRASATAHLARLHGDVRGRRSPEAAAENHLRQAERDIAEFLENPEVRKTRPPRAPAPPGRPIGH